MRIILFSAQPIRHLVLNQDLRRLSSRLRLLSGALIVSTFLGCGATPNRIDSEKIKSVESMAPAGEISLQADRQQYEQLRQEIPEEVRKENDESALLLEIMEQYEEEPSKVRARFNRIVRKERDRVDKELRKARDDYGKEERKKREEFLKESREERARFVKKNATSEERRDFSNSQDTKRRDFFAEEKERRNNFESMIREKRLKMTDSIREKNTRFNQEYQAYSKEYYERKKALDLKKKMERKQKSVDGSAAKRTTNAMSATALPESDRKILEAFDTIPKTPATILAPAEGK